MKEVQRLSKKIMSARGVGQVITVTIGLIVLLGLEQMPHQKIVDL